MRYFFTVTLFVFCILAGFIGLQYCISKDKKYVESRLVAAFCLSSALWSVGFGILLVQDNPDIAHFGRIVGMIGVFLYLITAQMLVCYISGCGKLMRWLFNGISYTGIIIYFFTVQRDKIEYIPSSWGMTYSFKAGIGNTLYITYCVVLAVTITTTIIYMLRVSKVKRIQAFAKKMMIVVGFILVGMMLDTVFPLFGMSAIPGSTMTQFLGVVVLHFAVQALNRSRINVQNMSEYIYYSISVPVLVYDADERLQIMNDAASAFLGIAHDDSTEANRPIDELFEISRENVFGFKGLRQDVDVMCHRNRKYCNLVINKIHDHYGDDIGYIIIVTDLSERIKTMQELEDAMRAADAANQAKSTFLANMSHEIRTPMNAIIGFSEILLKMELEERPREFVQDIKDSSENLLAIINDLLDISKIESGKMELVCTEYYTGSLFQDIFLIINTQAKRKGLIFDMTVARNMPNQFYGDKIRIRGVLINLLNNAVKYTKQGTVKLEANVLKIENDIATLEFKVIDTGVGIKEEEQERLFESFAQVDRKVHYGVEGTGLGLAIVKGYVTLMNGDVTVSSVYGEGSVFTAIIEQKVIDGSPMDKFDGKAVKKAEDFSLGNMKVLDTRVLVVDDNLINLKVASSTLAYYGLLVDTASSGADAIEMCRQNHYQMVFMDQMMPQMDGIEAMREIRKIDECYRMGGECKIIVLTANAIAGARELLVAQGFDEFLGKPMNFKQLERVLAQCVPKDKILLAENDKNGLEQSDQSRLMRDAKEIEEIEKILEVQVEQGIAFCGGRLTDYLKVLQLTYSNGEPGIKELQQLQQQGNYKDYTIKIHGMKSTALSIGAREVSDMAKAQELAGKDDDYSYIDAHMDEFIVEYHKLLERIRVVLERYEMLEEPVAEDNASMLTEESIKTTLLGIRTCMDEFDFAGASKLVREMNQKQMPEEYREDLTKIGQWMDEMEEDKIRELIDKLL